MSVEKEGTEEYFLNGFHLAKVREQIGGIKAVDSCMFLNSVEGLLGLGWKEEDIIAAVNKELAA